MAETPTYKIVSEKILEDSISSALFIDDKALEGFKSKNYNPTFIDNHNRTLKLYEDLKSKNCLLHSFKYTKSGWKKNKEFYLKNKDLLILDWQLENNHHDQALQILDEAVKRKSLHFTCIYSQENAEDIKRELNSFYWGKVNNDTKTHYREEFTGTDLNDYWEIDKSEPDWGELESLLDNIINANSENIENEEKAFNIRYNISQELSEKINQLDKLIKNAAYQKLKTILTQDDETLRYSSFEDSKIYQHSSDPITLYINHTIVKIFGKDVEGNQLYNKLLESLLKEHNIFLTLMGLEMRNRFRENSAFIGKDFDNLTEEAFFYHKEKNETNHFIFVEFLRDILKDQVASFLYERKLDLFEVLEDYFNENDGSAKLDEFKKEINKTKRFDEVFKLNYFYNRLNIEERSKNDFLRFGDVFLSKEDVKNDREEVIGVSKRYFLCLTPHCDCLNPSKINNQFWFIEGKLVEDTQAAKKKALDGADGKYLSFIKIENKIEAIYWENSSWECKPKTFFIENNKFNNNSLSVYFNNTIMNFELLSSLKENYAQRLANKAFGYPLRVGIDFVKN